MNQDLIQEFKHRVIKASQNPKFIHHKWFMKYHLEIVEKIANELCSIYAEADSQLVNILVWLHDYGKILNFDKSAETTLIEGRKILIEIGFPEEVVNKVIRYAEIIDKKLETDLDKASIEIKILSSADAAAHFVGPFFFLWWYENSSKPFEELMQDNIKKARKDWERKIVLPEVRETFRQRYELLLEHAGQLPNKFIVEDK